MSTAVPMLVMAVGLVLLGWWGYRNAGTLPPSSLRATEREHRRRVIRRGALASWLVAVVFVVFAAHSVL